MRLSLKKYNGDSTEAMQSKYYVDKNDHDNDEKAYTNTQRAKAAD